MQPLVGKTWSGGMGQLMSGIGTTNIWDLIIDIGCTDDQLWECRLSISGIGTANARGHPYWGSGPPTSGIGTINTRARFR